MNPYEGLPSNLSKYQREIQYKILVNQVILNLQNPKRNQFMMGDFRGRDLEVKFGVTPIRAVRRFKIENDELRAIVQDYYWVPGENLAEHMGVTNPGLGRVQHMERYFYDCHCGFYAYHGTDNGTHQYTGTADGIIEAYGQVSLGTEGLRCTKAKIVAIHPTINVLRIPWLPLLTYAVGFLVLSIINIVTSTGGVVWYLLGSISVVIVSIMIGYGGSTTHRLKKRYPEVDFFRSKAKMLEKYPLSPVEDIYP